MSLGARRAKEHVLITPLIRQVAQRDSLSDAEKDVLAGSVSRIFEVGAVVGLVREHDEPSECKLLLEGWACRNTLFAVGKPQILALQIPGDFVDLQSYPRQRMDHSIVTLMPCKIAIVPHEVLREITELHPHLTRLL